MSTEVAAVLAAALLGLGVALLFRTESRTTPVGARRWKWVTPGLVVAGGAVLVVHDHTLVLVAIGCAAVVGAQRLRRRQVAAREAAVAATRVMEACEAVAAELTAGRPPTSALRDVVGDFPELGGVAVAADLGADVPTALRELAAAPGRHDLRLVAAAWQVATGSGAGLAGPMAQIAATVRDRRRTARVVEGELASAHATARIMAALPVVFLVAASGLGGDPWGFLTTTSMGLVCLTVGLSLTYAGLAWLQRITDRVDRPE